MALLMGMKDGGISELHKKGNHPSNQQRLEVEQPSRRQHQTIVPTKTAASFIFSTKIGSLIAVCQNLAVCLVQRLARGNRLTTRLCLRQACANAGVRALHPQLSTEFKPL